MRMFLMILLFGATLFAQVRVAAAANVTYALDELIAAFHRIYPDTQVRVSIGSSGKLTAQIENGAPFDIFMSADMRYPKALYERGYTYTRPIVYVKGKLVLLAKSERVKSLDEITKADRIAIANPRTAPYGKAAMEVLRNKGLLETVQKRLVYAESVAQALSYTLTAADVGFVAKSSLMSPKLKSLRKYAIDIDPKLYHPIAQGVVLLKNAKKRQDAIDFFTFLFSKEATAIFRKYGYVIDE